MKIKKTYLEFKTGKKSLELISVNTKIKEEYLRKHLKNQKIDIEEFFLLLEKNGEKISKNKFCLKIRKKAIKKLFQSIPYGNTNLNVEDFSYSQEVKKNDILFMDDYSIFNRESNFFPDSLQKLFEKTRSLNTGVMVINQSLDDLKTSHEDLITHNFFMGRTGEGKSVFLENLGL